jgi:uncharacterized membrane protein SpoIIM required for sporulation
MRLFIFFMVSVLVLECAIVCGSSIPLQTQHIANITEAISNDPIVGGYAQGVGQTFYAPGNILSVITLFSSNLLVAFFAYITGPISLFILGYNGFMIGYFGHAIAMLTTSPYALAAIAPHGIIELAGFCLFSAAGLNIFYVIARRAYRHEHTSISRIYKRSMPMLKWGIVLLLIAAAVETYITPLLMALVGA